MYTAREGLLRPHGIKRNAPNLSPESSQRRLRAPLFIDDLGFSGKLEQAQAKFVTSEEACDRYYELTPIGFCRYGPIVS